MVKNSISLVHFIAIIVLYPSSDYAVTWAKGETKFSTSTTNDFMRYLSTSVN